MTLQKRCLAAVRDCPRTAAEVATRIHVPVKAASSALTTLVRKGYVFIAHDEEEADVRGVLHKKHVYEVSASEGRPGSAAAAEGLRA